MAYRYGHDETFTRAMDRGDYASAYETETLDEDAPGEAYALARTQGDIPKGASAQEYCAGYVLGFFGSYELHEIPDDWRDEVETLRAENPEDVS